MAPVFRKRERGATFARIADVFWCEDHARLAKGRTKRTAYL